MVLNSKRLFFIAILLCGISCQRSTSAYKETQVFRYNESSNISSLDPAFAKDQRNIWATHQLFNGLVRLDDALQVQPDIATHWTISEDALVYTFSLRKEVYFHSHPLFGAAQTRTVVAEDVRYSLLRLTDPQLAAPGGWVMQQVEAIDVLDSHTLQIKLKQPFPAFLGLLAMKYCSVVPKEAVDYFGDRFRANPIGTGPFQFKLWVENTKLVLRKNPLFYEKDSAGVPLPYLEAVAITFLPDKQSEFLQFIQGNLDFMKSLDASYKDDIITTEGTLKPKYAATINLQKGPYLNTEYLGIYRDTTDDALQDLRVRQALNYGFDREKMMTYLRNGIGIPATHGFIPKGLPGFSTDIGYTYQPEKAKVLLAAYTADTGKQVALTITSNSNYLDICEYLQKQWQQLGVQVQIEVVPPSTLRQGKSSGAYSIFRASWIADYPDAENYMSLFYSPNFAPNGPNYTHFKNATFDALYKRATLETAVAKRIALYQQMDSIITSEAPVINLYYDEVIRFTQKNVQGLGVHPTDLLDLSRVKKTSLPN